MDVINVDTDQIIPKLHLRTIKRTGLGKVLFDDLRFNPDGTEKPGFILNQAPYRDAQILVAGDNFGCGSSREHAPWALLDFGDPLRHLQQLRRHLLQQLLQERHPANRRLRGRAGRADGGRFGP